ncbi:MAG: S1/P1 nuclease [Pseudomonadota bacterium]|nr:S1/P1 nuclease [Pseudomonadota bacterium]
MDAGLGDSGGGGNMIARTARRCLLAIALSLAALGGANPVQAWDAAGHRAVADIAMANVKPQTATRINALLRAQAKLHTSGCPLADLDDAATWPDCLRGDPGRWHFTFAWHYQNVPVCGRFDIKADCPGGNCVSAQIDRMRRILADRRQGDVQRLIALAFLSHFIGDIHQPLHVGDHDDQGGNEVAVGASPLPRKGDNSRPESLHSFWDTLPEPALADASHPIVRVYSPAERARIATGDIADWARESYQIARNFTYARAFHHDPCVGSTPTEIDISEADVRASLPIVRWRLVQAGLRLARVLDQALAG